MVVYTLNETIVKNEALFVDTTDASKQRPDALSNAERAVTELLSRKNRILDDLNPPSLPLPAEEEAPKKRFFHWARR